MQSLVRTLGTAFAFVAFAALLTAEGSATQVSAQCTGHAPCKAPVTFDTVTFDTVTFDTVTFGTATSDGPVFDAPVFGHAGAEMAQSAAEAAKERGRRMDEISALMKHGHSRHEAEHLADEKTPSTTEHVKARASAMPQVEEHLANEVFVDHGHHSQSKHASPKKPENKAFGRAMAAAEAHIKHAHVACGLPAFRYTLLDVSKDSPDTFSLAYSNGYELQVENRNNKLSRVVWENPQICSLTSIQSSTAALAEDSLIERLMV